MGRKKQEICPFALECPHFRTYQYTCMGKGPFEYCGKYRTLMSEERSLAVSRIILLRKEQELELACKEGGAND